MRFVNMLQLSIVGMFTFPAFASAKPITTAVEPTSAGDIDMVAPPAVVIERLCCTSDCETCVGSCPPTGCPVFPWNTCCNRPLPTKRDDDQQAAVQNRELVQSVDILEPKSVLPHGNELLHHKQTDKGQDSRDVDVVGPPPPLVEICCKRGCVSCTNLACPSPRYDCSTSILHPVCCSAFVAKRDGIEQAFNLRGELIQLFTPADGLIPARGLEEPNQTEKGQESRDVDTVSPPGGPLEVCCDSIKCLQCSRRGCPPPDYDCGGGLTPVCCAAMIWGDKRDRTEQVFNSKGELVQWVTPADGSIPAGGVDEQNS